jgi:CBS domain containing-hemolysin-like protein
MQIEIVIGLIILIVMVFLATVDMAFSHMSDVSLRRLSADADEAQKISSAQFLREIVENRPRFRMALSSAIQILLICFAVLLTLVILAYTGNHAELLLLALVLGLAFTVIFRQIIPRLIVRNEPETKLLFLLPVVQPLYSVVSAFMAPFTPKMTSKERQKLEATVAPDAAEDRTDDMTDDFQALMEVGEAEGIIEESERELIETMVEFSETRAGEIMTPRTEICAIPIDSTVVTARNLIIEEKYSRLPVYRDTIDNIEGVIYVRDLLHAWADGKENEPIQSVLRDAFFVPETKTASELLKSMQSNHVQVAIVIDEYGGVAGLVTVEDILEEIVGEIEDEDIEDEEIIEIIEGADGYWDVLGSTEIDKIERLFDIEVEDEDFTTIAGLVTSEAGYVPKVGEHLTVRGLEVEILKADDKKVSLLRLRKALPEDRGEVGTLV